MNNWKYKLIITNSNNEQIVIETPIRMECTISFGINQSSATASFTLYNLSSTHRAQIRYSPALLAVNRSVFTNVMSKIELYVAKDGQSYTKIYQGALLEAYSQVVGGSSGVTTHITANNIPIWMTISSHIFKAGTSKREAIKTILRDIPDVTLENLGSIDGNFLTDTTCDGNAFEQIQKICGSNAFVENGNMSIIPTNECITGFLDKITDDAVILGTPIIKGAYLSFKCLFIPELRFQQYLKVESKLFPDFNNSYRVVGYTHTLVFSEEESGTKTTDVDCYFCDESMYQDIVATQGVTKDSDEYKTAVSTRSNNIVQGEKVTSLSNEEQGDAIRLQKHLQTNAGRLPSTSWRITPDISWVDMLGFYRNTRTDLATIKLEYLYNCVAIAKKLQAFKNAYFPTEWLKINCGWRSNDANIKAGGVGGSLHLYGKAIDFTISGSSNLTLQLYRKYFWTGWQGGHGCKYQNGYFIHVDNGSRRAVYKYPN